MRNGIAGHLTLSAVVVAVYPFIWRRDRSVVLNGLLFGAVFLVAAHAIIGPLLRLTRAMWNFRAGRVLPGLHHQRLLRALHGLLRHISSMSSGRLA